MPNPDALNLRAGEWVEVRSKEEILRTLDEAGHLEALPFMPEMLAFCGQRFRVHKRAHKTCDPVNGIRARGMVDAVHLQGLRCDGSAHGGCQAGCLLFWKEAWLKRAGDAPRAVDAGDPAPGPHGGTERDLVAATVAPGDTPGSEDATYVCQATRVADATCPLRWWDPRQYWTDLTSGNVTLAQLASALAFYLYHSVAEAGVGCGSAARWIYDAVQRRRGGAPYPLRSGRIARGERTPVERLDLAPGELVRVKSYPLILETLDTDWKNRGLYFDAEMVPFCGGTFRVLRRIERIIHEKTGKMLNLKSDTIVLEGVECQARYAKYRKFCPRGYYQYCREIWLERVGPAPSPVDRAAARDTAAATATVTV